jgi:hypothetical protein
MNPTTAPHLRGLLREEALQALQEAVGKVIAEHKRLGMPVAIWRDGKVVRIPAEEAEAVYLAAKAKAEADAAQSRDGA